MSIAGKTVTMSQAAAAATCTITVTSPNGGEVWTMGENETVQWSKSGTGCGSYVKIELYRGSNLVSTIDSNTDNDGSTSWTVPTSLAQASDYRVKITDNSDTSRYDFSNSSFTILQAPPPPPPPPGYAFFDDFNDGDYTSNPTWTVWNNDDYPGQVDVVSGAVRFLRQGAGGNGGGVKLIANVSIPVDQDTNLQFDGKATSRSVGNGCGWTCNEYPVNMELELDTPSGTVTLRYAINYGNAVEDQDQPTFKQRTKNVAQDTWVRGITYRIRDAWPDATAITKITIFAAGWDFEGYMDNVGIVEVAGSSPSYSEDFSTDPGFTSLAASYAYWDSSQHNYYVKTRDNLDHKYWAYSPQFGPFDPASGDVTIQLDMMIENQNWGTYPGVRFFAQEPADIGNPCIFSIFNGNADNNRELIQVNSCLDPSKGYKTPQWSVNNNVWYTVSITLKNGGAKADIVVRQKSNGQIIGQWTNVDFPTSSFAWFGVGFYDNPDYGSDWAPIRIDNVSISQ